MLKIYISADLGKAIKRNNYRDRHRDRRNEKLIKKLLAEIEKTGHEMIYSKQCPKEGNTWIEERIDASDCLLAIVDEHWVASSWRITELTNANRRGKDEIPVFLYFIPEDSYFGVFHEYREPKTYTLPQNAKSAVNFINAVMRRWGG